MVIFHEHPRSFLTSVEDQPCAVQIASVSTAWVLRV